MTRLSRTAVSPIRTVEAVHCFWRGHARAWAPLAPVLRGGRIQTGVPRWLVQRFAEADYCYGVGTLTMKVDRIEWDKPVPYEGDTWLEVEGVVIDCRGQARARRQVLVRAQRLPLRQPRRRPRLRP
jgi:hypothetical protein